MRRDIRRRPENQEWWEDKKVIIGSLAVVLALLVAVVISVYTNNSDKSVAKNGNNSNQIISLAPEDEIEGNTESASSSIGNKVEESKTINTTVETNTTNTTNSTNMTSAKETAESIKKNTISTQNSESSNTVEEKTENTSSPAETKEESKTISFDWPIKGDILKAFSIDNLLYSSTLQEWTIHNGIDIKADKASVVNASADGTVKSIKNDPRYGLTVVIEHQDGYKTVYSNLLTAEFVVEGEKVNKGQSIGTVGNTASFEVADDFHLHFEILKDSEYIDPMIYLK